MTDIEIANSVKLKSIERIAKKMGIKKSQLIFYGIHIAKLKNVDIKEKGKLILVTAMTSNKSGIGKTTVSIGLADAMNKLKHKTMLALREPSLGPVFGIKGGATGGGLSQVLPMEEINLHFTGDFHAVTAANNLLASIIDNHIFQGNKLDLDANNMFFKRCIDVNDRSLREIEYKIGENNIKTSFNITAASEVMAILSLSYSVEDLKNNLGNIMVGLNKKGLPIYAKDLYAENAMCILLKDAIKPNLVQTIGGTPALIHCGPFANIAHGCNSIIATKTALSLADFVVTEAGFGSDLGGEKFIDIKSRILDKTPNAAVIVVTLSVIKEHGRGDLTTGFENVKKHIENIYGIFKIPCVVAINKHKEDSDNDISLVQELCVNQNIKAFVCEAFEKGGSGCMDLAKEVVKLTDVCNKAQFAYEMDETIENKINNLALKIYNAKKVEFSPLAKDKLKLIKKLKLEGLFVNMAKTQFSISDDKKSLGCPKNYTFYVSDLEIRTGAKMIVAIAGSLLLMPGLGKQGAYENMGIYKNGEIFGLF